MHKLLKVFYYVFFSMSLLAIATTYVIYQGYQKLNQSIIIENTSLVVPQGQSYSALVEQLATQQLIENNIVLKILPKVDPRFAKMQAGQYLFDGEYSTFAVLQKIRQGEVQLFRITFPEGSDFKQWQQWIAAHPHLLQTDYQDWLDSLISPYTHPEGLFFPSTYLFKSGTEDKVILKQAYDKMQALKEELADNSLLSDWYQTLILASIVEKETSVTAEMPKVASVFYNRLDKNMRLQTDPTVIYGLGNRYKGDITRAHLNEKTQYNTYKIKGLPPTPIAMPGLDAINAVLYPANTDYLYFVATGEGGHTFSRTLKEHNKAVKEYLAKMSQQKMTTEKATNE
ncbi:endolytic transglycosylase MltG [Catenovulum sediminis]|uniref:endolytic transglycosylase MltG n=1 Tax=Catenovulum sediminis TaxID=1740262 RepID=UPI00163D4E8C|nr:endolytic transglycosylase MltG [Catenovulum sediminis]